MVSLNIRRHTRCAVAAAAVALVACGRGNGVSPEIPTAGSASPTASSETSASPLPPIAAGRIAFHSDPGGRDDLYLMDGDGSNLVQLTDGLETSVPPVWSPDGTRLAFVCCLPARDSIYLVNADGSGLERLASVPGEAGTPGRRHGLPMELLSPTRPTKRAEPT